MCPGVPFFELSVFEVAQLLELYLDSFLQIGYFSAIICSDILLPSFSFSPLGF